MRHKTANESQSPASTDIERKLAEHEAAIERLSGMPAIEQALPRPPEPSSMANQLSGRQEEARQKRVEAAQAQTARRKAEWAKDAPRRNRITAQLAVLDQKIAARAAQLAAAEVEREALRKTL